MKISVIVPMFNSKKTIKKLIDSVMEQTYSNYELILVDDGSTDKTYDYTKNITKNNPKVKVYRKQNEGPGLARKLGFEKSTGDLLFFVDSDDWVTNNDVFQKIIDCFENDIDILFFDREDIVDNSKDIIKSFYYISPGIHQFSELNEYIIPGLGCKIFKKSILTSDMFFDSVVYEDLYTTYVYLDKCKNFYYINECFYTIFHESQTKTLSNLGIININKSFEIFILLDNIIDSKDLRKTLELRIPSTFMMITRNKKVRESIDKDKLQKIVDILWTNKTQYIPKNTNESKIKSILKKVYFKVMVFTYRFFYK